MLLAKFLVNPLYRAYLMIIKQLYIFLILSFSFDRMLRLYQDTYGMGLKEARFLEILNVKSFPGINSHMHGDKAQVNDTLL